MGTVNDAITIYKDIADAVGFSPYAPHVSAGNLHGDLTWDQWLEAFLAGVGASYQPDIVIAHYYGDWSGMGAHINDVWGAIWSAGASPSGIWFGEHGPASNPGDNQTLREQHLRDALQMVKDKPGETKVKAIFPYHSHADPGWIIEPSTLGAVYQDCQ